MNNEIKQFNSLITNEQEILSDYIYNNNLIYIDELKEEHFIIQDHKKIFTCIKQLLQENIIKGIDDPVDSINIENYMKIKGIKLNSDYEYISEVAYTSPSIENHSTRIKLLFDNYKINVIDNMSKELDHQCSLKKKIELLENTYDRVMNAEVNENLNPDKMINELFNGLIEDIYKEKDEGYKSGLFELDRILGNFQSKRLITIFARSGVGKSTTAIQIAANMAYQGIKVFYASGEMSAKEITYKIVSSKLKIPYSSFMNKEFSEEDIQTKYAIEMTKLQNTGIYISNTNDIERLENEIKVFKRRKGIQVVFVDYINNYLKGTMGSITYEIGLITRKLKELALKEDLCIVVLAQANRAIDKNTNAEFISEKINTADIQDSARIEQDSDQIIALYRNINITRPEVRRQLAAEGKLDYNAKDPDKNPFCIAMNVCKNRHGKVGTKCFKWDGQYSNISNF